MKYLHRNKMKQFYGDYTKNNTTPSKGQHHNHQHMVIMNENAENGQTNDVFVYNFVTSALNKAVDNTMKKYEEREISGVEESKSEDKTETVKETVTETVKETVDTPEEKNPNTKSSIIDLLKSKGVNKIRNPKTGRLKNIGSLPVGVLREFVKKRNY